MDNPAIYIPSICVTLVALYLLGCIRILYEYECGVVFRLGRVLLTTTRARADYGRLAGRPYGECQHANLRR